MAKRRRRTRRKPVPSEPVTVLIESLSHDGRGIAHVEGKTLFVDGALPGEELECHYSFVGSRYSEAKASTVITASADRVEPRCSKAQICGGCNMQHINPARQVEIKQQALSEQYLHFGGIESPPHVTPLLGETWAYRRKARLGVRYVPKKGGVLVGFREKRNSFITDIDNCPVLDVRVGELITPLRELLDTLEQKASIPQIEVSLGDNDGALVFRHLEELGDEDKQALRDFGQANGLWVYLQPAGPASVHRISPDEEDGFLSYKLPEWSLELLFDPMDFTQVNASINEAMVKRALEFLELEKNDRVLDLFCGLGNFTLPIARHCSEVIGVEGSEAMVKRGNMNAAHNGIDNAHFFSADLTQDFREQPWSQGGFDKVLLDPPRSGALEIVKNISLLAPQRIVYVSCNPATLARDAGELCRSGYTLLKTGVMDMFPHTAHVESIAVFEK
ncbi:MAG: 23S rRNA (uracil(1939)-C(5))-methyltransferase RlmD [Gammaproteobacteria bacterium]|nr:23S rRNA (uracil(1939)-C(5))-methyltransferase RlmD [Gammaproteobacteria bacterium]